MAGANLTNLAELIREQFRTPFTDGMQRNTFVYAFFPTKKVEGKQREWEVHYAGNTGALSYTESGDIPTAGNQSYKKATAPFKLVGVPVQVTGFVDAATKGGGGFLQALTSETTEAIKDLKDAINTMQMSTSAPGNSGADITGFPYIISDTGTYAGLDRSTYTWFQSYVLDNSGTDRDLTLSLMQDQYRTLLSPARSSKVTHIFTSFKHYDDYGNLMADNRRFISPAKMDAGYGQKYDSMPFNGSPVIGVPGMADGAMYFINKDFWEYDVLKDFDTEEKSLATKDAKLFFISHYAELVCLHPGKQGKIVDLA